MACGHPPDGTDVEVVEHPSTVSVRWECEGLVYRIGGNATRETKSTLRNR